MKIDIGNTVFNLKKIKNNKIYFPDYVNTYLSDYINFLEEVQTEKKIIQMIKQFSKNIYICLIEYYCGQHGSAKYYFDKALNYVDLKDIFISLDEKAFYRARFPSENCITKDEMFHIPFEERYKVSTQRFSYPGLPCLYLGSSYEVCCEELGDWSKTMNIAYIEKCSKSQMTVLDLHFFEKFDFKKISKKDGEKFFRLWPLVACCSFVYENSEKMKFRPDYIIPQLLLEYIIDKNTDVDINGHGEKLCGIKYHSVKKEFFNQNDHASLATYNNYVFPVQSNQTNGHCHILKEQFNVKWVCFLDELKKK